MNVFVCVYVGECAMCEDKYVYCVFYKRYMCVRTFKNAEFLVAYVCIYKSLLHVHVSHF